MKNTLMQIMVRGSVIRAGEDDHQAATFNPFADLKAMMANKK